MCLGHNYLLPSLMFFCRTKMKNQMLVKLKQVNNSTTTVMTAESSEPNLAKRK